MNDGHILFQVRRSVFVIPDLIREPVVCCNVDTLKVFSSVLNQVQDDESSLGLPTAWIGRGCFHDEQFIINNSQLAYAELRLTMHNSQFIMHNWLSPNCVS